MARYHVNPRTGGTSVCGAKISCPFGDMETEHYGSREEAAKAFENKMKEDNIPDPPKKTTQTKPKNLEEMFAVRAASEKDSIPDVDYSKVSKEDIDKMKQNKQGQKQLIFMVDTAPDKLVQYTMKDGASRAYRHEVLTSPNPNLSIETKKQALKNVDLSSNLINDQNFPVDKLASSMTTAQKLETAIQLEDYKKLDKFATELIKTGIKSDDKNLSTDDVAIAIYNNPKVSNRTKERMLRESATLQSRAKLESIMSKDKTFEANFSRPISSSNNDGNFQEARFEINPNLVKEHDLTQKDIEVMMKRKLGSEYFDPSFDARTSTYSVIKLK